MVEKERAPAFMIKKLNLDRSGAAAAAGALSSHFDAESETASPFTPLIPPADFLSACSAASDAATYQD